MFSTDVMFKFIAASGIFGIPAHLIGAIRPSEAGSGSEILDRDCSTVIEYSTESSETLIDRFNTLILTGAQTLRSDSRADRKPLP